MWQFMNPFFLWAGAAAAIPLILHLMQRRRIVPIPFSTLRFLKLAQRRSSNRIRMENFLLWFLRTLLLILLILAFAMPILRTHAFGRFMGTAQRDIAIVWDASFSMAYESSRRNVWEDSRQIVLDLIDGLGTGDRIALFIANEDVTPVIEQPSGDLIQARALVKEQGYKPTGSQLEPALLAAADSLKESGGREREIHLISDGQALAWKSFKRQAADDAPAVPGPRWDPEFIEPQTQLFISLAGADNPENTAPLSVEVRPTPLMAGIRSRLTVSVLRSGPAQNISLTLNLNGSEINRRSLVLPENGVETVTFPLPPLPAGNHEGWVETPPDGLNIDNRLYFLLRVRDRLPVAVIDGSRDAVFFLSRALNPVPDQPTIETTIFSPAEIPLEGLNRFSAIFLCNALPLGGEAIIALENYVREGGLLTIFPGNRSQPRDYQSWSLLPAWPESIAEITPGRRRRALLMLHPADPLLAGMQLAPGTVPTLAIQRELRLARKHPDAFPLIGASTELPLLLARNSGQGRMLLFTVSADRLWSDLPLSPFFLPFVHQIVRFGAGLGGDALYIEPARNLKLSVISPDMPDNPQLLTPSGKPLVIRTIQREHRSVPIVEEIMEPGFYKIDGPGDTKLRTVFAVNAPREESDLTRVKTEHLFKLLGVDNLRIAQNREQLSRLLTEHRLGRPLGEVFLWLALFVSMIELVTANRLSRRIPKLTEKMHVEPSGKVRNR